MEILKDKDMKLLSRRRLYLKYEHKGATPSRLDLIKEIAKQFKAKEELVVIKHIYPQYGKNWTKVIVNLYSDEKKMKLFELEGLLKKHEAKPKAEAPTAEEKPAAEPAAEPATEEAVAEKAEEEVDKKLEEAAESPVEEAPKEEPVAEEKPVEEPKAEEPAKEE